ncbi:MAG: TIGR02757 family protein [Thermodesulfobacteriota bacterium]
MRRSAGPLAKGTARSTGAPCAPLSPPGSLPELLERLYRRHHRLENLAPDPLVFARRFREPREGEVAGLIAASLAYGQVAQIMITLEGVFSILAPSPKRFLEGASPAELLAATAEFSYRFHKGSDLALFLHLLRQLLDRHDDLLRAFRAGDPGGPIGPALSAFADALLGGDPRPLLPSRTIPANHPVRHLVASPAGGGPAKRLCLYLRWMVRRDALDPGFWHGAVDPARLVVPLDTHVARAGRELGLTPRKAADWKTACEITEALRRCDPADPVRFDFSLFRFGMGRGPRGQAASP